MRVVAFCSGSSEAGDGGCVVSNGGHFVLFGEKVRLWSEIASDLGPDQFARLSDGRAMTGMGEKGGGERRFEEERWLRVA